MSDCVSSFDRDARAGLLAGAALLLWLGATVARAGGADDYARLSEWRFATAPSPVAGEVSWQRDTARWTLLSGSLRTQKALAGDVVTGFVFEGSGRFVMEIPDRHELAQLRRFRGDPGLRALEVPFSKLVVRGSHLGSLPLRLEPPAATVPHAVARERHDQWLEQYFLDVDARILAALRNPGAEYLRVDMLGDDGEWIAYEYDSDRLEEIQVQTMRPSHAMTKFRPDSSSYLRLGPLVESWVSLDRPEDRRADGRPAGDLEPQLDLEHVDVGAHIGDLGKSGASGRTRTYARETRFTASLRFQPRAAGLGAVRLFLHPYAAVDRVTDGASRELEFLRHNIGGRTRAYDKRLHDPTLTVFLAEATVAGEPLELHVEYGMEIANFVSGASWYPGYRPEGLGLRDLHTARISVTAPDQIAVRAQGKLESESEEGKLRTTVYRVERPAKMVSFVTAERPLEERLEVDGVPQVVVFSPGRGMYQDMLHDTGADLVNSMAYFQKVFASRLPIEHLDAAMIAAGHGQAFDGLLHLSDYTGVESSATVPFFRAHEVAHQWWGHLVGWKTYRDQWLSEGFAEYSAMLFMRASMDNGAKLYAEALRVSHDELTGSIQSAFSPFSRPYQNLLNKQAADRIGPIGHGWRANVANSPGAYFSLAYNKGAYVLHMLRMVLRGITKSDDTFFTILQDFVETHGGGVASTEDFQRIVVKHAPADWGWFFDQWVYQAAVPTYAWDHKVDGKTAKGKVELTLRVRQSDVPEGFRMLVPVWVELPGGKSGEMLVMIDQPENNLALTLPARPRKVVFNPDHAVLARMRKL